MKRRKKVALFTFGCKLNQFETIAMHEQLQDLGFTIIPFEEKADVYIINSCTVTNKADYHSRMKIRQALRSNPEAFILVTGCSAQVFPKRLADIGGVDLIIGNQEKGDFIHYLRQYLPDLKKRETPEVRVQDFSQNTPFQALFIKHFHGYTRAFLKIQEGCNNQCTYCIVPKARGPNRSARPETIFLQAKKLGENGYKEIVLTGIHLGTYGVDLEKKITLADLLLKLIQQNNSIFFRLSSIEPTEFTKELKEVIVRSPQICAHLHIPLQSGDDFFLRKMHRPYKTDFYRELVEDLVAKRSDLAIGADLIIGFPGETEESFQKTFSFVKSLPLAYLHVFSFSARQNTEAIQLTDQVDGITKRKRCSMMRELSKEKSFQFRRKFLGKTVPALILEQKDKETEFSVALTGNYIKVLVQGSERMVNQQVKLQITGVSREKTIGKILKEE